MAFDQVTRNRLQRFVNDARKVLELEFGRQLQNEYGLDPSSGAVTPLNKLAHLSDAKKETAHILRDILAHYIASEAGTDNKVALERIVREQAFTVLNRIVALRMAEARGLLLESIDHGYQAKGFQLYARVMGNSLGETGDTYRCYLFSVFDELAQDLPDLFDRYSPQACLFPRENALLQLIELVNQPEISPLWAEDEAIGWIFQYFNSKDERKKMRDESAAPRNSRELAVRNQFFTPRYVVEFLVDNTLGRLWFQATGGETMLRERCRYLLVKPDENPASVSKLRDPRTLKLLDPACGSMHFGLYAFDLFTEIYQEAWAWEQQNGAGSLDGAFVAEQELPSLCELYPDEAAFLCDVPRLIIEHNIYGVDVDPRAAQIAALALWLRAQRAWHEDGIKAVDRPAIGRGNVVAAIAPPHETELREQLKATLDGKDASLFEETLQLLKNLPELGVLLRVEQELPALIRQVYGETGGLFEESDAERWQKAEMRLREALVEYAQAAKSTYQSRLFAQDAMELLRMIDLIREKFDVVVMNPPFGEVAEQTYDYLKKMYTNWANNILCCFITRSLQMIRSGGFVGSIFDRTITVKSSYENHRREDFVSHLSVFLDTGWGVLDANVETACACFAFDPPIEVPIIDVRQRENKQESLIDAINDWKNLSQSSEHFRVKIMNPLTFLNLPNAVIGHDFERFAIELFDHLPSFEKVGMQARQGHALVSDIHFRLFWEVDIKKCGRPTGHSLLYNGAEYSLYLSPQRDVVVRGYDFDFLKAHPSCVMRNPTFQFSSGIGYGKRGEVLDAHYLRSDCIFTSEGQAIHLQDQEQIYFGLALLNSPLYQYLINLYCGQHKHAGYINLLPIISLDDGKRKIIIELVKEAISLKQKWLSYDETTLDYSGFLIPVLNENECIDDIFKRIISDYIVDNRNLHAIENKITNIIFESVKLDDFEKEKMFEWAKNTRPIDPLWPGLEKEKQDSLDDRFLASSLLSELIGVLFGRWGAEIEKQDMNNSQVDDEDEINYTTRVVFSNVALNEKTGERHWVHQKIFVEDPTNISCLETCLNELILDICRDSTGTVETSIIQKLGVHSLQEYFSSPNGFFAEHLRQYSKSRRQAPIYWPLATTSGNYTIWLYYPSLTNQTLYTCVNDFLEPKLKQISGELNNLRTKGSKRSQADEKQFEKLQTFELELMELRDTLLKIAPNYHPNQDDGVQITAAPLWPLFRHKPWQKVLKETWEKLEKGDYDWAHLAMYYWPERVRAKCKTDKFLAIAHGSRELYMEPVMTAKKKPKK